MAAEHSMDQSARGQSTLLPAAMLAEEFGKVYVHSDANQTHVEFTVRLGELEGEQAERWRTGVALDASASMKNWYGRNLTGSVPPDALQEYERKGWIQANTEDGCRVKTFRKEAYEDAIRRGFVKMTDNIVEPLAQDFIGYLARELDTAGGTTVIYWACGDGGAYEVVGDFTEEQCKGLQVNGPKSVTFGEKTNLVPALKYFVDRFVDAPKGMYVFITDGKLDDLPQLKRYTIDLAKAIAAKKRNSVKCVLIGVGVQIDEKQMRELDDLDTGTDVDIWDHKIAKEMRDISDIIVELVDENKIVAPTAVVYDASGNVVCRFSDGLPARASFSMPRASPHFELEVAGRRIRQSVVVKGG
jgi:hypothetical protein